MIVFLLLTLVTGSLYPSPMSYEKINMELENNLKKIRRSHKLTQQQLAQRVGVSRQSVYAIETGKSEPSLILALKMANALGVNIAEIFRLVDSRKGGSEEDISPFTIF